MTAEARNRGTDDVLEITAEGSIAEGQILQLNDGRAAYALTAIAAGAKGLVQVSGLVRVVKATSITILWGGEVFWDYSADNATFCPVNDRDFLIGTATEDGASSDNVIEVDLNKRSRWTVDVFRDPVLSVFVGTQGLNTMGIFRRGGCANFINSSTNEAQKMDMLSVDGFSKDANAIVEAIFTIPNGSAGAAPDLNIGLANGTHATDFDSITEYLSCHIDGNSTNINFQSKDTSTTVASTDSTKDYTAGSAVANRVYVWFDLRNPADVQVYVNAVNVLPSSVFNINAVANTLFLIAHQEKTAAADTFEMCLHALRARIAEQ